MNPAPAPLVQPFFDAATHTYSYVVHCPVTQRAAVIDSVSMVNPVFVSSVSPSNCA